MDQTTVLLAVVGAHLSGQPLNRQLTDRDARLVLTTRTAPHYRLFVLDTEPPKPGLVSVATSDRHGGSMEVEVWELGVEQFGSFVAAIPRPLGIGKIELADGSEVSGFICETEALDAALEITTHGGWRAYLSSRAPAR